MFKPYGKTRAAKREVPLSGVAADVLRKRLDSIEGEYLSPSRGVGDKPIIKVNNTHAATLRRSGVRQFRELSH